MSVKHLWILRLIEYIEMIESTKNWLILLFVLFVFLYRIFRCNRFICTSKRQMKESRKLHLQLSPIKEEWQSNLTQFKLPVLRIDNNREETRLHACSAATETSHLEEG